MTRIQNEFKPYQRLKKRRWPYKGISMMIIGLAIGIVGLTGLLPVWVATILFPVGVLVFVISKDIDQNQYSK